jgi:hypothetical protein
MCSVTVKENQSLKTHTWALPQAILQKPQAIFAQADFGATAAKCRFVPHSRHLAFHTTNIA